jgi:hypothetical protein
MKAKVASATAVAVAYLAGIIFMFDETKWYFVLWVFVYLGLLPMAIGAWLNEVFSEED